ncbi:MAG: CoA-transferase, partial [Bdellovibrionota bacterium]
IHKLGHQRLERIRRRAEPQSWHSDLEAVARGEASDAGEPAKLSPDVSQFIGSEMMICAAGRKMAAISKELSLAHILAGVGAANLSAWLCLHHLRAEGRSIETMAEIGYFGYEPRPSDPYIFNFRNTPTCVSTTDILTVLGMLVPDGRNLGSLGAAQVDRYGNVNSTCIPGKMHFMGSGGGNDVASGAKAVCVTAYLGKDKFKERVDYVTSPGKNVRLVVTDRGVFEKEPGASELVLTGYYTHGPTAYKSAEEAVREIKNLVGWDLKVREKLDAIGAPTKEELELLRIYDPYGQFLR